MEVVGTPEASVEPADNEVIGMGVDVFGGDLVIHIAINIGGGVVLGEVGFHTQHRDDGLVGEIDICVVGVGGGGGEVHLERGCLGWVYCISIYHNIYTCTNYYTVMRTKPP